MAGAGRGPNRRNKPAGRKFPDPRYNFVVAILAKIHVRGRLRRVELLESEGFPVFSPVNRELRPQNAIRADVQCMRDGMRSWTQENFDFYEVKGDPT